jgi:hypothetical protein
VRDFAMLQLHAPSPAAGGVLAEKLLHDWRSRSRSDLGGRTVVMEALLRVPGSLAHTRRNM